MRVIFALVAMCLAVFSAAYAVSPSAPFIGGIGNGVKGSSSFSIGSTSGTTFNITDYTPCNGTGNDSPGWAAVSNAMKANSAVQLGLGATLLIPPGSVCNLNSGFGGFAAPNLTIIATSATINGTGQSKWFGDIDFSRGYSVDAFTNTITAGDTCATVTAVGTETNFQPFFPAATPTLPVVVAIAGEGAQVNSFPPNYVNWEYAQVASTPPGQVCFTAPVKNTYPIGLNQIVNLQGYNCANFYCGGPPKLIRMAGTWPGYVHFIGGTYNVNFQTIWASQNLVLTNVTMPVAGNNGCVIPSINGTVTYINSNLMNCQIEEDKMVDTIVVDRGSFVNVQSFQSSAPTHVIVRNSGTIGSTGIGTDITCTNGNLPSGFFFGSTYGLKPQTFTGTNCNLGGVFCCANNQFTVGTTIGLAFMTYTGNGQFVRPNLNLDSDSFLSVRWTPPSGSAFMYHVGANMPYADFGFTILSNTYAPNVVGGFGTWTMATTYNSATMPPPLGGNIAFAGMSGSNISCTNCTGSAQALELSMPYAQNKKYGVYLNRTYTCANNMANIPGSLDINKTDDYSTNTERSIIGNFVSMIVTVTPSDSNPTDIAAGPRPFEANLGWYYDTVTQDEHLLNVGSNEINVLQTGTRTITTVATSGAQPGDGILHTPGATAFMGGAGGTNGMNLPLFPITNGPAAQCPVVNVEIKTTQ